VTTAFTKQGHYANNGTLLTEYAPADVTISYIGDLLKCKRSEFHGA